METGSLNKSLLSMRKIELKGVNENFQVTIAYKHYLLCFHAADSGKNDCTIIDTQNETVTSVSTGLELGKRTGYAICHWKDNVFVVHGGEDQKRPPNRGFVYKTAYYQVHFLQIIERDIGIFIETESCGLKDTKWSNSQHSAHIYKDNMYIFGGKEIDDSNEMWKFDLNAKVWTKCQVIGESSVECRRHPGSVLLGNKMYIFGGLVKTGGVHSSLFKNANDLFVIDLETLRREKVHENSFLPVQNLTDLRGDLVGQKIFISSPYLEEFLIYDPAEDKIEQSQGLSPKLGYTVKTFLGHSILFRIFMSEFAGGRYLEIHNFDNTTAPEDRDQPFQSIKIKNKILPQVSHMQLLWKEKLFADVTFVVQNEEIPAHRNILIKSYYFLTMFQSGMMESNSTKINVPDISPVNFKAILEFIYFGKIALTEQLALDLIVLADKYFLSDLKADCESYLSTCVSMTNFLRFIKVAETADAQKLEERVAGFLIANLDKVSEEIDSNLIPQNLLIKAMKKMKLNQK